MTDLSKFPNTPVQIKLDPRHAYVGKFIQAEIVEKNDDLIYHLGNPHEDFRQVLTEVVHDFFADAETFGIDYIPEVDNFSLYALNAKANPLADPIVRAKKFLDLLDNTLGALQ